MNRRLLIFGVALVLGAGLGVLLFLPGNEGRSFWTGMENRRTVRGASIRPDDPVLQIPVPVPDAAANLPPSPLNRLLEAGISPQEQTEIVGQLLLDYWSHLHTLPAGTWEEVRAALAGQNAKQLEFVDPSHPAVAGDAFRPAPGAPGVHLHVISASGGAFQLIYDGPDARPFTDDDLVRNFPLDLEF